MKKILSIAGLLVCLQISAALPPPPQSQQLTTNVGAALITAGQRLLGTNFNFLESITTNSISTNTIYVADAGEASVIENYVKQKVQGGTTYWTNLNGLVYVVFDPHQSVFNNTWSFVKTDESAILYVSDTATIGGLLSTGDDVTGRLPVPTRWGFGTYARPFSAVGQPQFDGASVSNLSGLNLQAATIPASALASGVLNSVIGNLAVSGNVTASNVYANLAGASALPVHGGELAQRLPKLPFFIYTGSTNFTTEGFVTNNLAAGTNSGLIQAWNAGGFQVTVLHVPGWQSGGRNPDGTIRWNTNSFPDGPVSYFAKVAAYGAQSVLHQYFNTDESVPYVKDSGQVGSLFSGDHVNPVMSPQTVIQDIGQFYRWGNVHGIQIADLDAGRSISYQHDEMRRVGAEIMYPSSHTPQYWGYTPMHLETVLGGGDQNAISPVAGYETSLLIFDQGWGSGTAVSLYFDRARIAFARLAAMEGPGHFISTTMPGGLNTLAGQVFSSVDDVQAAFAAGSLFPAWPIIPDLTNTYLITYASTLTNWAMMRMYNDPGYRPAAPLFDTGVGGKSGYIRPLVLGGYEVVFENETGGALNMTFDWSTNWCSPSTFYAVNCPGVFPFCVSSNSYFTCADAYAGTNPPVVNQSVTVLVTNLGVKMLRLWPAPVGFSATAALATSVVSPLTITTVNAGTVNVSGPIQGTVQTNTGAINALEFVGSGAKLTGLVSGGTVQWNTNAAGTAATNTFSKANVSINLGGGVTASSFTGSGSGLSAISVPDSALQPDVSLLGQTIDLSTEVTGNLPATSLSGTLLDARLSGNVALLNANQTFSGANTFSGTTSNTFMQGTNGVAMMVPNFTNNNITVLASNAFKGGFSVNNSLIPLSQFNDTGSGFTLCRFAFSGTANWDFGAASSSPEFYLYDAVATVKRLRVKRDSVGEVLIGGTGSETPSSANQLTVFGNEAVSGTIIATNGFTSTLSNASPVIIITLPANDLNGSTQFTNTFGASGILAFAGATSSTAWKGSSTIAQSSWKQWPMAAVGTSAYVPLRSGEAVSLTNTIQPTLVTFSIFP